MTLLPIRSGLRFRSVIISGMVFANFGASLVAVANPADNYSPPWVGTWAAAPQSVEPNQPVSSNVIFTNQTIRQIVHTSVEGRYVRVRISNTFDVYGSAPLSIGDAHIAVRQNDSTIMPGSDHQLTFGGSTSILIPTGSYVISDPVDFNLTAFADLSISIYFPGPTGRMTYHSTGLETNYIASGDVTDAVSLSGAQTTNSWYFLTGIEVSALNNDERAIVALGASITDGYDSTLGANKRWTDDLALRLAARYGPAAVAVLDEGISGNRSIYDTTGPNGAARFDRDVVAQSGVKYVVVADLPINDVGAPVSSQPSETVTASEIISGLQQLILRAHEKGLKIIGATLTPFEGAFYWTQAGETIREQVNDFIRSGAFNGVVDFAGATADPHDPLVYAAQFDSGDHLHPNDAGYQAMADAFDLSLFDQ